MKPKSLIALVLALALWASAAQAQQVAMGRYVQEKVSLPQDMENIAQMWVDAQGRLCLLGEQSAKEGSLAVATLEDDGAWRIEPLAWSQAFAHDYYAAYMAGDIAYVCRHETDEAGQSSQRVYWGQGGVLAQVDAGQMLEDLGYIMTLAGAGDRIIAGSFSPGAYSYDAATGARRAVYDRASGEMWLGGGKLYTLSQQDGCALVYDIESGELLYEMTGAPLREINALYAQGDSLYLLNAGGVYRIALGGSMWEQLVDGALTDLRLPYSSVLGLALVGDLFYALVDAGDGATLLRFAYDPGVTTLPSKTLSVYTLRKSRMMEQAASLFQSAHPDYLVEITTLLDEGVGATRQDVISALNVELLGGAGPDVLVLDGLPVDAYIEKGVLADLSPVIDPLMESGELLDNLFTPFYRDGAIYQAPTRAALPTALTAQSCAGWDDLLEQVQQGLRLPGRTREGYLEIFLPTCFGAWFTPEGGLDEQALAAFLTGIDQLYAAGGAQEEADVRHNTYVVTTVQAVRPMAGYGVRLDEAILLGERYDLVPLMLSNLSMATMELTQLEDAGGSLNFLPGQSDRVYAPCDRVGVNARGAHKQAALDFVGTLLGQEAQDADIYDGGAAVNRLSLQKEIQDDGLGGNLVSVMSIQNSETGEIMQLSGRWPSQATRARVGELMAQARTPYAPDETLLDLIRSALTPFCLGEMGPQAAAQAAADKVRAYLAE